MRLALRIAASLAGVAVVTLGARGLVPVNATTAGFAYLLLVLIVASTWGLVEATVASLAATFCYNLFFFPPFGTLTIAEPHNWVALFSFLATALIASRLSHVARRRASDALARQQDVERLYTFSRAILLIDGAEPFPKSLVAKLAEIFSLDGAVLYVRRTDEFHRAGPVELGGLDDQLRGASLQGTSFADPMRRRTITAVRLGSEPIASLAIEGPPMQDSVLQGIANLVAIGLERARAQDLAQQIEAARQSEQLRTTLIDAMAHEFKTPLTSIKAATSSLLASPALPPETRTELLRVADEEAAHLNGLIEDAIEMARLDAAHIDLHLETSDVTELVGEVAASMRGEIADRPFQLLSEDGLPPISVDRRLLKLACRQLLHNAVKYSPPAAPILVRVCRENGFVHVAVTDRGAGIPARELPHIFERFYRSPDVKRQIPGSGLGLSIARSIANAHNGDVAVTSRPGETTFRLILPLDRGGERS
ncbi:MAG: ATP-binding protein [Bryobacteraceae bacterium]